MVKMVSFILCIFYHGFKIFFIFWPCHVACGILVPQPGIKPTLPALEAQSLNHWTARKVLSHFNSSGLPNNPPDFTDEGMEMLKGQERREDGAGRK